MDSSIGTSSNKRKEIVFDYETSNMNEALNDIVNRISKFVFDEKICAHKNEDINDLVNRMNKDGTLVISTKKARMDTSSLPALAEGGKIKIKKFVDMFQKTGIYSVEDVSVDQHDAKDSPMQTPLDDDEEVLKNFKRFDTAVDHSDHLFATSTSPMKQPPKYWVENIQQERRILEEYLPETIFVRVYESRMDLLRAVIIGQQGTPYHDGLFVFDVFFPSTYPISPPIMRYHSYGLNINPMLYICGEVCLYPFSTIKGTTEELWVPGASTMLQLLVSIQARFFNKKPLLIESGYWWARKFLALEYSSILYNENIFIRSLKTMEYTMNKPPKNFEGLVVGHFRNRVRDILMACKAYMEGVQVGCVQEEEVNKGCGSITFRNDVSSCIKPLVAAFFKIGANEAKEFLFLSEKKSCLPASAPTHKMRVTMRATQSRSRMTQQRTTNAL